MPTRSPTACGRLTFSTHIIEPSRELATSVRRPSPVGSRRTTLFTDPRPPTCTSLVTLGAIDVPAAPPGCHIDRRARAGLGGLCTGRLVSRSGQVAHQRSVTHSLASHHAALHRGC